MKMRKITLMGAPWILLATAALGGGCSGDDSKPPTPEPLAPFTLADVEPEEHAATFTVNIDNSAPELDGEGRQPLGTPVQVTGGGEGLGLRVFAKHPPARPGYLWLEIFVENQAQLALRGVKLEIGKVTGASGFVDVTNTPLSTTPSPGPVLVGGVAPEGLSRAAISLPEASGDVQFEVTVRGTTTSRLARSSAPIASTPDGAEVWSVFTDSNIVGVIATATNARVAQVAVPGAPSSIAISPDGAHVLVTSHLGNTVTVVDRTKRKIIQTLGAAEGIGREPQHIVIAADGTHAFISHYVDDKIVRLLRRGDRYEADGSVAVGRRPAGLSVSPDGKTVLVAHALPRGTIRKNEAWVSVIDGVSMKLARDVGAPDNFNEDRVKCLADVFGVQPSRLTMEGVATALAGVFLSPSGATGWVPGMRISPGPVLEIGSNPQDLGPFTSGAKGRFSPAFLFMFDARDQNAVEAMRSPGVLDIPNVNLDYVKCIDAELDIEFTTATTLDANRQVNAGVANPNGNAGLSEQGRMDFVAFSRGARRMFGLSSLADELLVYDAATLHPVTRKHMLLSGANPHGMAMSPDGKRAYVAYRNSTYVSVLDTSAYADVLPEPGYVPFQFSKLPELGSAQSPITSLWLVRNVATVPELPSIKEIGQVPLVDADPLAQVDRLGRILFYSSSPVKYPQITTSRQAACATCHPGGGSDGSGWATVEGERRTMSLRGGVAGRGWLHASGTHRGIKEFVDSVVKQRLGGAPDAETVDALAKYVAFGIEKLQAPTVDAALAAQGEKVFATKCSTCHQGETFSSGAPDPNDPLGGGLASGPALYNVGTKTTSAGMLFGNFFESIFPASQAQMLKLIRGDRDLAPGDPLQLLLDFEPRPQRTAGELKAPSLVGVWDQVVFFHDGRFDKIEDAVHYLNDHLKLALSAEDERAVVEYLKTL